MRLTVLVDNATLTDRYFLAEPGLSIHIQADGQSILLDAGYGEALVRNAPGLGVDLLDLDRIVLSHSHLDHTWGLGPLFALFTLAGIEGRPAKRPVLTAHPEVFASRYLPGVPELGSLVDAERAGRFCDLDLSAEPVWLTENVVFLGRIPRETPFEPPEPMGKVRGPDRDRDCLVADDTALACRTAQGLVIVTGCSHSGICNIVKYALRVCGPQPVRDIVGGLHLLDPPPERIKGTLDFIGSLAPARMHPCHCTDLASKIALASVAPVAEVGVGLRLDYPDQPSTPSPSAH